MTNINRETYRAALQKAVDLKGADYLYEKPVGSVTCRYMEEGQPSCLHATALHTLGITDLSQYEGLSVKVILADAGVEDDDLLVAAARSQLAQDTGKTWGAALEAFDSQFRNPVSPLYW